MHVALWGPSDHVATAEADALRDRLAALDLIVSHVGADAAPNAETQVVIVNSKMQVGAKAFDWLKDLKLVVTTTSGYDHIDLAAARQRGIRVARCARSRRDAVVDTSLAMATALLRRLPLTTAAAAGGRWMRAEVKAWPVPLFSTLTVGILGQGVIGRRASEVWQALGATVLASDPAVAGSPALADVLPRADVVTLHCSLTRTSRAMIDASALASMKPGAVLVNTARGECVDEAALLADKRLAGIGLDVFACEPWVDSAALLAKGNVLVSPHSAGWHTGLGASLNDEVVTQVNAWLKGLALEGEVGLAG
jgi:phosphoglycerate dehydrogenase-like enzyme